MTVETNPRGVNHVHAHMAGAYEKFNAPSAREVDGWVYLTGVVAAQEDNDQSGFKDGFERAFKQIAEVLAMAGCTWNDVVSMTSHHTDIGAQFADIAAVKDGYCDAAPYPAWSILGIGQLANPRGFCEIIVVARKPA
jgi:enamine deaminase RidA (YjgF/YER057c/UK114 family)